jgi:hypothetical protein
VKLDRYMMDMGLVGAPDGPLGDEAGAVLLAAATGFLRAGGVLLWADWVAMAPETRAAFVSAKRAMDIDMAVATGRASQGAVQAAAMAAPVDDGESLIRCALKAHSGAWRASLEAGDGRK